MGIGWANKKRIDRKKRKKDKKVHKPKKK